MAISYNRIQVEGPFENVMEDINYLQAKESLQKNFIITNDGWAYLHKKGISEEDLIRSRKTLTEFCAEHSMIEGKHFTLESVEYEPEKLVFKNGHQIIPFNASIKKTRKEFRRSWAQYNLMSEN